MHKFAIGKEPSTNDVGTATDNSTDHNNVAEENNATVLPVPFDKLLLMNKPPNCVCHRLAAQVALPVGHGTSNSRTAMLSSGSTKKRKIHGQHQQSKQHEEQCKPDTKPDPQPSSSFDSTLGVDLAAGGKGHNRPSTSEVAAARAARKAAKAAKQKKKKLKKTQLQMPATTNTMVKTGGTQLQSQTNPRETSKEDASCQCTCVYDWVPEEFRHRQLGCFGRMDKNTTGALLLGSSVMNPSSDVVCLFVCLFVCSILCSDPLLPSVLLCSRCSNVVLKKKLGRT